MTDEASQQNATDINMTQSLITIRDNGDCTYGNLGGHIQEGGGNTQRKQEEDTYSGKRNRMSADRKYIRQPPNGTLDAIRARQE